MGLLTSPLHNNEHECYKMSDNTYLSLSLFSGIYSYNLFQEVSSPGVYTLTFRCRYSNHKPMGMPMKFSWKIQLYVYVGFSLLAGSVCETFL